MPADKQGFLNWNPDQMTGESPMAFTTTFQAMTTAAGEFGCGLESQLESIYRFLVDPNPSGQILTQNCPQGLRALKQRVSRMVSATLTAALSFCASMSLYSWVGVREEPIPAVMQTMPQEDQVEPLQLNGLSEPIMGDVEQREWPMGRLAIVKPHRGARR